MRRVARVLLKAIAPLTLAGLAAYWLWQLGGRITDSVHIDDPVSAQTLRWLPLGLLFWTGLLAFLWWLRGRDPGHTRAAGRPASPARPGELDATVGYVGWKPVIIPHADRFLHTMVVGTTGTGKSSRVLRPMIWQDLQALAAGKRVGVTVIEPKGDLVADVAGMCDALGVPYVLVDPERENTARFNPLDGDPEVAAEVMRTVLAALFGKQDAFFSQVQQTLTQYTIRMLKELRGDAVTLPDVLTALMDPALLRQYVDEYRQRGGDVLVVRFFEAEVLGRLADKFFQFAVGVRVQLGDIVGNRMLRRVLTGKSDVDLDAHLAGGGVLLINTAMGRLGKLGDAFGKFVMLHVQYAVFRRPGREHDRDPHLLYIDEFPRYVNEDFERMLALGRSFRCATVLACQSTSQLVLDQKPQLREVLLGNCRNKVLLNLDDAQDAERFSRELGELDVQTEMWQFKRFTLGPFVFYLPDAKRIMPQRKRQFWADTLLHLTRFTAVVKITVDGQPQRAVECRLELSGYDLHRARWQRKAAERVAASRKSGVPTGAVRAHTTDPGGGGSGGSGSGGPGPDDSDLVSAVLAAVQGQWPGRLADLSPIEQRRWVEWAVACTPAPLGRQRPRAPDVMDRLWQLCLLEEMVEQGRRPAASPATVSVTGGRTGPGTDATAGAGSDVGTGALTGSGTGRAGSHTAVTGDGFFPPTGGAKTEVHE